MSTETATDPREDRLPKWAQEELRTLRRRTAEAERLAEAARLDTAPDTSNTLVLRGIADPVGLGNGTSIRFVVNAANPHRTIDVRLAGDQLDINASYGALAILPRASNAARVGIVER